MSTSTPTSSSPSPFYIPLNISKTALLLSDVQTQILARFPPETQVAYLSKILELLTFFRQQIASHRTAQASSSSTTNDPLSSIPLIIHHTLPFNLNNNAFVSPYNKLAKWVRGLEEKGFFAATSADPHCPNYAIPKELVPEEGWGTSKYEIVLGKLQPNCFASSDLIKYLGARGIRHVVLVGLTTMGSVLGSARYV